MKTKINRNEQFVEPKLPALYESVQHPELVVLFIAPREGIVVGVAPLGPYELGTIKPNWVECYNTDAWQRLGVGDSVTITQE